MTPAPLTREQVAAADTESMLRYARICASSGCFTLLLSSDQGPLCDRCQDKLKIEQPVPARDEAVTSPAAQDGRAMPTWVCAVSPPWARRGDHVTEFGLHLGGASWVFVAHGGGLSLRRGAWCAWLWEPAGGRSSGPGGATLLFTARKAPAARALAELWASTYGRA